MKIEKLLTKLYYKDYEDFYRRTKSYYQDSKVNTFILGYKLFLNKYHKITNSLNGKFILDLEDKIAITTLIIIYLKNIKEKKNNTTWSYQIIKDKNAISQRVYYSSEKYLFLHSPKLNLLIKMRIKIYNSDEIFNYIKQNYKEIKTFSNEQYIVLNIDNFDNLYELTHDKDIMKFLFD